MTKVVKFDHGASMTCARKYFPSRGSTLTRSSKTLTQETRATVPRTYLSCYYVQRDTNLSYCRIMHNLENRLIE